MISSFNDCYSAEAAVVSEIREEVDVLVSHELGVRVTLIDIQSLLESLRNIISQVDRCRLSSNSLIRWSDFIQFNSS